VFSEGWTTDTVAAYMGPPELAVRMICSSEEPITTKMKNPSMTGPTEKPYLDFSLALMSTRPRLWMFLWNLAEEAAKTRLEAAMIDVKLGGSERGPDFGVTGGCLAEW